MDTSHIRARKPLSEVNGDATVSENGILFLEEKLMQRQARRSLVLWRSPLKTLYYFVMESLVLFHKHGMRYVVKFVLNYTYYFSMIFKNIRTNVDVLSFITEFVIVLELLYAIMLTMIRNIILFIKILIITELINCALLRIPVINLFHCVVFFLPHLKNSVSRSRFFICSCFEFL